MDFLDGRVTLHGGDCREVIRTLADASIDSVVTDPPYALVSISKRFANSPRSERTENIENPYGRTGRGFMGARWDNGDAAFAVEFWAEVYRVLKPGGHVVAFGGTRTYHRLACAIEDAGFGIRDQIGWAYGSGFPKSHNVGKGIAKRRVEDVEPVRVVCRYIRSAMDAKGLKSKDLPHHFGNCDPRLIDHWAARDTDSQPSLPTPEQWVTLIDVLGLFGDGAFAVIDAEVTRLNERKGLVGERWSGAEIIGEIEVDSPGFGEMRFNGDRSLRELDGDAAQWDGWGTALKPAWEPIVLARKPIIGTVAENVLEHGTGALNIDGCRVELAVDDALHAGVTHNGHALDETKAWGFKAVDRVAGLGRWPANIIHDGSDEVLAAFPDSDGQQGDLSGHSGDRLSQGIYGDMKSARDFPARDDTGSAARFFYTAKADAEDRLGSKHPTVKPLDLMQYLVRLVTPPGGLVLDPFAGTGTTGEAAWREGMRAVLIEREPEYQADIARRMELAENPTKRAAVAASKNKLQGGEGTPLFGDAP